MRKESRLSAGTKRPEKREKAGNGNKKNIGCRQWSRGQGPKPRGTAEKKAGDKKQRGALGVQEVVRVRQKRSPVIVRGLIQQTRTKVPTGNKGAGVFSKRKSAPTR